MRDHARYLRWCLRQSKGIAIVKPSENLVRAYLQKSRNAIKSMEVNAEASIIDWAVSASYYAKYFAVYSLLAKIGVKCEIHDCTIALFEYLFRDTVPRQLIRELRRSKENRVEAQYYPLVEEVHLEQMMSRTKSFVLDIGETMDGLDSESIARLRSRVKDLTATSRTH